MWQYLVVILLIIQHCESDWKIKKTKDISYQIAGLFENGIVTEVLAFNESTRHNIYKDWRLDPIILSAKKNDSYSMWRNLCSNDVMRPIAVVGPQNAICDRGIRDQCALANIPHIQASWQPLDPDTDNDEEEEISDDIVILDDDDVGTDEKQEEGHQNEEEKAEEEIENLIYRNTSINFYPSSDEILVAYARMLKYYQWKHFAAIYEDEFGLLRIQKIIAEYSEIYPIFVRKIDRENSRLVFKELAKYQESRVLIDCDVANIPIYMKDALDLKMITHYQHYIFVSMDASMISESLEHLPSNFTWLSATNHDKLTDPQHHLTPRVGSWVSSGLPKASYFKLSSLLMDDIVKHILKALASLHEKEDNLRSPSGNICDPESQWEFGAKLQDEILKTQTTGVSGHIEFDETGKRINYVLYVNEIHGSRRRTIGTWDSADGSEIKIYSANIDAALDKVTNKKFIIISRQAKPYFFNKPPCEEDDEECINDPLKYQGFSVDLVEAIFREFAKENYNYTYEFSQEEYLGYGKFDPKKKKYDGLIGDLLDKKADLAVCDFTITEERKKVVDFSVPFMSLGISILFTQERKVVPGMFSFLNPYTFDVWMHTATAYLVVSIVLFVCSRISPADWENPQPCDKDPEELENIWNFKNCVWLTMGSIMTQGCDILPKAIGSRWVTSMWWFFAVIVCQTYIAQLSASMTSALADEPINSVEDLAKQTKILYGAYKAGSTLEFFRSSKDKMYQRMYETMMANPVVLVNSNEEGEKRVLNGKNKYAFFMESSTIEYKVKRNCELKQVGGLLDSKDYGIAMPANSPFRSEINRAILKLKESTELDAIKKKWWDEGEGCDEGKDENDQEGDLEMESLIGAFLVLVGGLVISLFITAAEFMNEVRNIVVKEKVSHKEVFIKELKASLNFFQLEKPVLRNPSRAPSLASSLNQSDKLKKRTAMTANFMDFEKEIQ